MLISKTLKSRPNITWAACSFTCLVIALRCWQLGLCLLWDAGFGAPWMLVRMRIVTKFIFATCHHLHPTFSVIAHLWMFFFLIRAVSRITRISFRHLGFCNPRLIFVCLLEQYCLNSFSLLFFLPYNSPITISLAYHKVNIYLYRNKGAWQTCDSNLIHWCTRQKQNWLMQIFYKADDTVACSLVLRLSLRTFQFCFCCSQSVPLPLGVCVCFQLRLGGWF